MVYLTFQGQCHFKATILAGMIMKCHNRFSHTYKKIPFDISFLPGKTPHFYFFKKKAVFYSCLLLSIQVLLHQSLNYRLEDNFLSNHQAHILPAVIFCFLIVFIKDVISENSQSISCLNFFTLPRFQTRGCQGLIQFFILKSSIRHCPHGPFPGGNASYHLAAGCLKVIDK